MDGSVDTDALPSTAARSVPLPPPVFPSRLETSGPLPPTPGSWSPDDPGPSPEPERPGAPGEDVPAADAGPPFSVPRSVSPRALSPDRGLDDPALYFNRELSWLDFNWRVLHQAMDPRTPLLERVRFLSITQSNLDEFVRKRVGGLKRQQGAGVRKLSPDGRRPEEQLALVREAVRPMQAQMGRTWRDDLLPGLRKEGIVVRSYDDLDSEEKERLYQHFLDHIYPVLTPLAVDPGHPFPFISNLSLSLAIMVNHPDRDGVQFARVKVPVSRGRWIELRQPGHVLPVEHLVARHVQELFRGTTIVSCHPFRVTRNADLRREEEEAEDLLQMISEELRERRFAPVVRLEVDAETPRHVVDLLTAELELDEADVYEVDGLLDFTHLDQLADRDRPSLTFPPFEPVVPPELHVDPDDDDPPSVFDVLDRQDVLVHHPYDSFTGSVQRFVEEAAEDPQVVAIKLTLYRTSENSPIVHALVRAAEGGKQVACLVEVTARFDEQQNIEWGQMLERAGVHVTYGLVGLKTHAKVALVIRDDGEEGIRTYCHIGTGNYHATTARIYTDLGLLTSSRELGYDLVHLFHYLTGHAPEQDYRALIVAPRDMRRVFEGLVEREIEHQRREGNGRMILKMNALDDVGMIQELYRASREGVSVELVVRGHSRLRPGLPGVSENIRVVSIIGRFLEHDRVFYFHNGGDHDVVLGSADWRRRNLVERVEAVVRITDPGHRERLRRMLDHALDDNRLAWDLDAAGHYRLRVPEEGEEVRSYHEILMNEARERKVEGS